MQKITSDEYKKILVKILDYINELCEKNNIKFSLIGGSLLGAVRHHGIIPWDDDIDICMTKDEYQKLLTAIKNDNNGDFKILDSNNCNNYFFPFAKIIYTKTYLRELDFLDIPEYGAYVDVFEYRYISNNKLIRKIQFKYYKFWLSLLRGSIFSNEHLKNEKNIFKRFRNSLSKKIGYKRILQKLYKIFNKNSKKTNYVMSNWPCYNYNEEVKDASIFDSLSKMPFETLNVPVFDSYDKILKETFGDYMKYPPKEKQVSRHNFDAYWKNK